MILDDGKLPLSIATRNCHVWTDLVDERPVSEILETVSIAPVPLANIVITPLCVVCSVSLLEVLSRCQHRTIFFPLLPGRASKVLRLTMRARLDLPAQDIALQGP